MNYFIRHGETDYNRQGRVQGHLNIPLNEKGISQAKALRDSIDRDSIEIVFCGL